MEEFRARLIEFRSFDDLSALIRGLVDLELSEPVVLPIFVVRSVLEGLRDALDRAVHPDTWDQVRDALSGPMEDVLDACQSEDRNVLFEKLNTLTRQWTKTRKELAEW